MTTRAELRAEKPRRPLLRSFRFWIPVGIVLLLLVIAVVGALVAKPVYDRAMSARASLEKAMPLATTAKEQIIAGDADAAKATTTRLTALTADARAQTDDGMWKSLEWMPVVGANLHAVRTAAAVTDDLVTGAVVPATELSLDALSPANGAIDVAAIGAMQSTVTQAAAAVDEAASDLGTIDHAALIPQVEGAVEKLSSAVDELQPLLGPAAEMLGVLPAALGADGPRNYLAIFQNNAESRGTGGNPAALVLITVDQGKITLGQQAASSDFRNGRPDPVTEINPETAALYGDNVGRWIPDATMTPDFAETATIMRAWWAEEFDTPVDAVISFDPIALSYLLRATGPAVVAAEPVDVQGQVVQVLEEPLTLTSENAAQFLLNDVYWQYPDGAVQNAIFAASTRAVFDALTSGKAQGIAMLDALSQAADEGRLMYTPASEEEAELIGDSTLAGKLPTTNENTTVLGAYVNDSTTSKLDFYAQFDVDAASTQCTSPDAPMFTLSTTLTNTVTPELAPDLPYSIAPALYYPKGDIATNMVLYGPVGATATSVSVDGAPVKATVLTHLGRPAVKVPIYNTPGQTHEVEVQFEGVQGETYGPLDVRHTPMVRAVSETLTAEGCD